jgi:hypothetical protein
MSDESTGRYMRMDSLEDRVSILESKFRILGFVFLVAGIYLLCRYSKTIADLTARTAS